MRAAVGHPVTTQRESGHRHSGIQRGRFHRRGGQGGSRPMARRSWSMTARATIPERWQRKRVRWWCGRRSIAAMTRHWRAALPRPTKSAPMPWSRPMRMGSSIPARSRSPWKNWPRPIWFSACAIPARRDGRKLCSTSIRALRFGVPDILCGLKAFRIEAYRRHRAQPERPSVHTALALRLVARRRGVFHRARGCARARGPFAVWWSSKG